MFGSSTDTPFGFVDKSTQDSNPVDNTQKRIVWKKEIQMAHAYFNEVKLYLNRNVSDYPLWNEGCKPRGAGTIKINKITI